METQTFNILCVSKIPREDSPNPYTRHEPAFAPTAKLRTVYDEVLGVKIPKVLVQFGWKEYKLLNVTVGLSSTCMALIVETNEPGYKYLKLYTDKPAKAHLTVEDVLREAELEITAHGHSLDDTKKLGWWPAPTNP